MSASNVSGPDAPHSARRTVRLQHVASKATGTLNTSLSATPTTSPQLQLQPPSTGTEFDIVRSDEQDSYPPKNSAPLVPDGDGNRHPLQLNDRRIYNAQW